MNTLFTFTALLLVGLASAAPANDPTLHIDDEMFPEAFAIYTGENDITKIVIPLNSLNFEDEPEEGENSDDDTLIFFVEEGKGIYALKKKEATKILENGNDITSTADEGKQVFFGATDGIYTYNAEKKSAEKFGSITDNVIAIAVANGTNELYILTDNHVVYQVSADGTNKEEVTNVKDAQQIVLDSSNNLYYVDNKKRVYVRLHEEGAVKSVKGLPAHPSSVLLLKPPIVLDDAVPVISGKKAFLAFANGTAEFSDLIIDAKPTAYSVEASLLLYAGYNKKIYEYNLMELILGELLEEAKLDEANSEDFASVKTFFQDQSAGIQRLAKKPIKSIRA